MKDLKPSIESALTQGLNYLRIKFFVLLSLVLGYMLCLVYTKLTKPVFVYKNDIHVAVDNKGQLNIVDFNNNQTIILSDSSTNAIYIQMSAALQKEYSDKIK